MNALGSFQDLLTRAMGGDLSAFQQLQEAADLALRLGQEAFGTSTDDFRAIFDIVTGGLDQILGMDFMDLFGNVDPFGESDSLSALQSSVDLQTSALIAELEESRRDQANRMNAQTRVLEQINARLAGSSSGPPI